MDAYGNARLLARIVEPRCFREVVQDLVSLRHLDSRCCSIFCFLICYRHSVDGHRGTQRSTRYCWTAFTIDQSNSNDSHQSWSKLQTLALYSRDYRPLKSDGDEWRNGNEAIKHTVAQWNPNNLIGVIQYYAHIYIYIYIYIYICDINCFAHLLFKLYARLI